MWGKSQLNRRNIVLVALTTSTAALALAGPVQAQQAAPPAPPVPTQAASVDMVKTRVLRLKDPDGNKPDEVAVRCVRTATQAGRKCIVKVQYPELECTDAAVMATYRTTAGVSKPVVTGLKLRCIRTTDLEDDGSDEAATTPAPVEQAPAPVQQAPAPAPAETDEQRAARQYEEERQAIEAAMMEAERRGG